MKAIKRNFDGQEPDIMCICLHPIHALSQTHSRILSGDVVLVGINFRNMPQEGFSVTHVSGLC